MTAQYMTCAHSVYYFTPHSALVKVPVIQDCLHLSNSSLYEEEEQECGSVNDGEW